MQKGISYSFFYLCLCFSKKFSWTSFLMIQMTKDWFNKSFLCIYYMLWNTSRKKFQKSCWEMSLSTIWTRNSYKREGRGSTFHGISEPNKETKIKAALQAGKFLRTTKAANEFLQKAWEVAEASWFNLLQPGVNPFCPSCFVSGWFRSTSGVQIVGSTFSCSAL